MVSSPEEARVTADSAVRPWWHTQFHFPPVTFRLAKEIGFKAMALNLWVTTPLAKFYL